MASFNFYYVYTLPKPDSNVQIVQESAAESLVKSANGAIKSEKYGQAFKLLATARNNFSSQFTDIQLTDITERLKTLTARAKDTTIEELYGLTDLTKLTGIYKFSGYVLDVSVDDMYGITCTIADSEDTGLKSLEVYGMTDIAVGSTIEFYGVPEFYSVTGPMHVEGF